MSFREAPLMSSAPVSRHRIPAGSGHDGPLPGGAGASRRGLARLLAGAVLAVCVLVLGAVAKLRPVAALDLRVDEHIAAHDRTGALTALAKAATAIACLLYTSDAADDLLCVDLGGRRIIK